MTHIIINKRILRKYIKYIVVAILTISVIIYSVNRSSVKHSKNIQIRITEDVERHLYLSLYTAELVDYYTHRNQKRMFSDIHDLLLAISMFKEHIFTDDVLPYDMNELLALVMFESSLYINAKGGHNDIGFFQVVNPKDHLKEINGVKDPYDAYCNTYMGMNILAEKYRLVVADRYRQFRKPKYDSWTDKQLAIVAYNGAQIHGLEGSAFYYNRYKAAYNVITEIDKRAQRKYDRLLNKGDQDERQNNH